MRPLQWLALSSAATALNDANCNNSSCSPRPYSTWMADSIISRGQGIASANSDASLFLQVGIVQTALLRLLGSPLPSSACCAEHDYRSYIQQGSDSIIGKLLNASQDTLYPLDRLSIGRNLLFSYTENDGNKTVESALEALRESIDLQPKNQYGRYFLFRCHSVLPVDYLQSIQAACGTISIQIGAISMECIHTSPSTLSTPSLLTPLPQSIQQKI